MYFLIFLNLLFLVVRVASEASLVVLAYVALKFLGLYGPAPKPSLFSRLRRALKAF